MRVNMLNKDFMIILNNKKKLIYFNTLLINLNKYFIKHVTTNRYGFYYFN